MDWIWLVTIITVFVIMYTGFLQAQFFTPGADTETDKQSFSNRTKMLILVAMAIIAGTVLHTTEMLVHPLVNRAKYKRLYGVYISTTLNGECDNEYVIQCINFEEDIGLYISGTSFTKDSLGNLVYEGEFKSNSAAWNGDVFVYTFEGKIDQNQGIETFGKDKGVGVGLIWFTRPGPFQEASGYYRNDVTCLGKDVNIILRRLTNVSLNEYVKHGATENKKKWLETNLRFLLTSPQFKKALYASEKNSQDILGRKAQFKTGGMSSSNK